MKAYNQNQINSLLEFNELLEDEYDFNSELQEIEAIESKIRLEVIKQCKYLDLCDNCGFQGMIMRVCSETGYRICRCGNMV